jgi:endonuclease/exonuclease/phosphatase family metal-dependent hydrolase
MPRTSRSYLLSAVALVTLIGLACRASTPEAQEARPAPDLRVATYNLEWFSEDANPERVANVRAVVANVGAHVWGLQEIQSLAAARQVWGPEWQVGMIDHPDEQQELAIAVREPYVLGEVEAAFPDDGLDFAFPGKRDVLRARVSGPNGFAATFYVVHMKSRRGGRLQTDLQRRKAQGLLAAFIMGRDEQNVVVLGDMNDAPDDQSVNILETGDLLAAGGRGQAPRLMYNLTEGLYDRDFVSFGLERLFEGAPLRPVVEGAKAENERLRGQDYRFPDDVRVVQILFDQILASPAMKRRWLRSDVYAGLHALRGEGGRTSVNGNAVVYEVKGSQASDHLPVIAEFRVAP